MKASSKNMFRLVASVALAAASYAGDAADLQTVGAAPAILYDAPSIRGGKLFVAPRGMPLEVVLSYGDWVKVRDVGGDLAWTESRALSAKRALVVRAGGARVRTGADDQADLVFSADKGLLLELLEPSVAGWTKVRHQDGMTGFVRSAEVWGE